ncbi:unnamed protein product [Heligmosomoides polygyrus]|uniref:CdiA_C domain-containing protein n=1 Tax=Heligmosomoides polygyrus TaxID=6339 RepID=A0A183G2B2_HELPZ|nr:unnamed protein product [Heligmosomoides polygyrus]
MRASGEGHDAPPGTVVSQSRGGAKGAPDNLFQTTFAFGTLRTVSRAGSSEIARFKRIDYTGDIEGLYNDLVEALDAEMVTVRYMQGEHTPAATWLATSIKRYLAANPRQVRHVVRAGHYEVLVGHPF